MASLPPPNEDYHYNSFLEFFTTSPSVYVYDEQALAFCASCNCCPRHKINKPTVLTPWVEVPFTNRRATPSDCQCDCRHMARRICRTHVRVAYNKPK